ncbi:MAG TPA: two-component regulator propeller domain-containing protein, partial [Puia sp.]|nr:two-component regulator propeller domain-containing protein [Puia sp.]
MRPKSILREYWFIYSNWVKMAEAEIYRNFRMTSLLSLKTTAMQLHRICIVLLYILLSFSGRGLAQTEHIHFRHFSMPNELSSYKVVKVLQDRYGFMWFATQDGLSRFDGKNMRIYNKSAPANHILSGTDITDILEDSSRNMLWAISSYGGLNGIDLITGNVKYSFPESDSVNHFSNAWLKCLVLFRDEIWIGSFDGITIIHPEEKGFIKPIAVPFQQSNKNEAFDINLMWVDEYERIWVFVANYGLIVYSGKDHAMVAYFDLATLHLEENNTGRQFHDCLHIAKDQLLLATSQGIKRIRYQKDNSLEVSEEKIPGEVDKEITSLQQDSSQNLWFATNEGLFKFEAANDHKTAIRDDNRADQHTWLGSVNSIFFDRQHNLWLGTIYGVAVAANPHPVFQNFFQSSDFKAVINRAYYVFPYNDSVEFVCAEDGFYRVDNSSGHISQIKSGSSFSFMFQHPDGNLIVSLENHLFIFRPPDRFIEIEKRYPEFSSIKSQNINSAVYCGDSVALLGSEDDKGVYSWNFKLHSIDIINSQSASPLKSDIVNTVYKDHSGRIWILSDNSFALYYPENKKLINYKLKNPGTGQPLNLF